MKSLFLLFACIFCFEGFSVCAQEAPMENCGPVPSLFVVQLEVPESLLENIYALEEDAGKHQWQDSTYYRETLDFGKVFHALEEGNLVEKSIPPFIAELRNRLFEKFQPLLDASDRPVDYDNCIVTIYQAGDGIAPHIDRNVDWALASDERNYYFGDSVIGFIVKTDSLQNLFFQDPAAGEASRFYLNEQPGMAFLFQGELRHKWKHGLLPIEQERISITFRKVEVKRN